MSIIFQETLTKILLFLSTLILVLITYFQLSYKYWQKKNVPTIEPHFPLGNTNTIFPKGISVGTLSEKFYTEFKKRNLKYGGVYLVTEPNLVIVDPEIIKDVLQKDFQFFVDRGFYHNEKDDPISAHLFALDGSKWRNLRIKLTPTFTSGKMKMMLHIIVECSKFLKEALDSKLADDIDIKEVFGRFTTDVIGSCALGIECNSVKDPEAEFRKIGKKIFEYNFWSSIKAFLSMNLPKLSLKLGVTSVTKEVDGFFQKVVEGAIKMRRETKIQRKDFMQILIDLKDNQILSLEEIRAQVFLFFAAGFETTSTTMTFVLYELARNPKIQEKLRLEIREVLEKYYGEITYEGLFEMKYLEQVVEETLRKYPPLPTLNRRCVKNYTLRDSNIVIEKDTPVLISPLGLHYDPDFFPNPHVFDPDRFNEDNKKSRHPFVYLPFGDGPRNCIGLRFGLMQAKIGIVTVVDNFQVKVSPIMKPVQFDSYTFMLNTVDKVLLRLEKI